MIKLSKTNKHKYSVYDIGSDVGITEYASLEGALAKVDKLIAKSSRVEIDRDTYEDWRLRMKQLEERLGE